MEENCYCCLCKKPMLILQKMEACSFCGKTERTDYLCVDGHYICEECRLASAEIIIRKVCESTRETDPMKIAVLLMKHPAVQMHGPHHHYLISSALLAAIRNLNKFELSDHVFDDAISRGKRIPLGSCGLLGVCGSAVGIGIAVSVATKATHMSDKERSLAMRATSQALDKISKIGGPRCCKASTFAALEAAADFFEKEFKIRFPTLENPNPCFFKTMNEAECLGDKCPYFR